MRVISFIFTLLFLSVPVWAKGVLCSQDRRAVDGPLVNVILSEYEAGLFKLEVVYPEQFGMTGNHPEQRNLIEDSLECDFGNADTKIVNCKKRGVNDMAPFFETVKTQETRLVRGWLPSMPKIAEKSETLLELKTGYNWFKWKNDPLKDRVETYEELNQKYNLAQCKEL